MPDNQPIRHFFNNKPSILLILLIFALPCISSLKVAILPFIAGSHPLSADIIAQHLIKRGHTPITIISNEPKVLKKLKTSAFALYDIERPFTQTELQKVFTTTNPFIALSYVSDIQTRYCDAMLSNQTLIQSLQDVDVIVADDLLVCSLLLKEVLNKPSVHVSTSGSIVGFHTFLGAYTPYSYVPLIGPFSKDMSFLQRAMNVIVGLGMEAIIKNWSSKMLNTLRFKHNIATNLTLFELRRKFSVYLATLDFAIEYPVPIPPNIHTVGPLTPVPPSPLPQSFEIFMQNSGDQGVIILSLGSELQIQDHKLTEMVAALSQLPHQIIWKTKQRIKHVPENVKIVEWMPQNDLLGHNKTIAFITHCGSNGVYEGAYHGVPMIGMPAMEEQMGNIRRIIRTEIGVHVDFYKFTMSDITSAVTEITANKRYRENAKRISKILKSSPRTARDAIVDWIEYVVQAEGAHHLKVEGEKLWFYELYNLDVMLFVLIVLYIIYRMLKACTKMIFQSKAKVD
ncbi:uncharacterized protein TRIADDRAFT_54724 [Trichoplax adhaerens]|uniref:UDP-glucuronosyltransferase n=1 Tax=Trichoplax adhaerens TaxID=10228 RepID=B3RST6_TRIAD|nr:hypothetical protein TRIADDRAFT_54724 [Trichoplax adhaerens]EDV27101.1 hypothetical protein TRIADDRAFT_54724 [Trichoplax adhaerens]|eukprot:XP_002111097.1 hypothetical protein TRIADDRAFT_54724 [Trichoplax adhaerens]